MPGFDGTGPRGMGPMTGGGRGFCSPWGIRAVRRGYGIPPRVGYNYPYYGGATPYPSYGEAPFVPQMTRQQELNSLKNQADMLKGHLEQVEARVRELGAKEE